MKCFALAFVFALLAPPVSAQIGPESDLYITREGSVIAEPVLLRHLDLSGFAEPNDFFRASAQFGDLNNNGQASDFIRYANARRMQAFAYDGEEGLTLLWDYTTPVDLPDPPERYHYKYLIWDVTGDGRSNVVGPFASDAGRIELRVLDGETGEVMHTVATAMDTPESDDNVREWRIKVTVANFRGLDHPQDIVMLNENDSNGDIYVYDGKLTPLWDSSDDGVRRIYAHYPWTGDLNGHDALIGAWAFNHEGEKLFRITPEDWEGQDLYYDHIDRAFIGNLHHDHPDEIEVLTSWNYTRAKLMDASGNVYWQHTSDDEESKIVAVGKFLPAQEGLQILYWDPLNSGPGGDEERYIHILDMDGNEVGIIDYIRDGYPIDWDGERALDIVFAPRRAELYAPWNNETLRLERLYEQDRLTPRHDAMRIYAHALDLTGDYREEVIIMDEDEMLIYGAAGDPPHEHPSPWDDSRYRLSVANMMNDNHPERTWFDWRIIGR